MTEEPLWIVEYRLSGESTEWCRSPGQFTFEQAIQYIIAARLSQRQPLRWRLRNIGNGEKFPDEALDCILGMSRPTDAP